MTAHSFSLFDHTILLSISGSRAYGMERPGSDVDVKGVLIPPRAYLIGCALKCEQVNDPDRLSAFLPMLSEDLRRVAAEEKLEGTVYTRSKSIYDSQLTATRICSKCSSQEIESSCAVLPQVSDYATRVSSFCRRRCATLSWDTRSHSLSGSRRIDDGS